MSVEKRSLLISIEDGWVIGNIKEENWIKTERD